MSVNGITLPSELNWATYKAEQLFYMKIKHNFKLHVLICLKGSDYRRYDILHKIYLLDGYRCHKITRYGSKWSHLHILFTDEQKAKNSIDFLRKTEPSFTAVLVDDLLKDWHKFELRSNYSPPWTLAIIDVMGRPPKYMDLLTENVLNSILQNFGQPYLLPYTAALTEAHVQVLFSSMTEALAACMAFGQWYIMNLISDLFCYRVRISPSNKESLLINISGGIPEEAFKLDYFLSERPMNRPAGSDKSSGAIQKPFKGKKSYPKDVKKKRETAKPYKTRRNNVSQMQFQTPLICIPVVAAPAGYSEFALTGASQQNFPDASVFQNQFEASRHADLGIEPKETGFPNSEYHKDGQMYAANSSLSGFDDMQASDALANCIEVSNSFQPISLETTPYDTTENYYSGEALVFERRRNPFEN